MNFYINDDIPNDIKQLVYEANCTETKLFVLLALSTGVKISDLASLKWKDINFNNKKLRLCSQQGERTALLIDSLVILLKKHKKNNWKLKNIPCKNLDYVFINSNGDPYNYHSLYYRFNKFSKRSSVTHVKYKDLRSSYYFLIKDYRKVTHSYLYKYWALYI